MGQDTSSVPSIVWIRLHCIDNLCSNTSHSAPPPPSQIRTHAKRAQLMETIHMRTEPYAFDYFFEQTQRERTKKRTKQDSKQDSSTDTSSDTDQD